MSRGKVALFAILGILLAVVADAAAGADVVRIALDWTPNTNHSGILAALELGYFAEENLDVIISEPGPTVGLQLVSAGRAEFAVSMQDELTMARAQGYPIVSIATLLPHNTSGFAALRSTGVTSPEDFAGRRYGGWGSDLESVMIRTVMAELGADFDSVELINIGTVDFATAARRNLADFFWVFYGWQGIHAELEGLDFVYIPLAGLSDVLDYYTPVIATHERTIAERPELVKRFVQALARGCVYAAIHPDEAAAILLRHAPELDRDLVVASQRWLAGQSETDLAAWGFQDAAVWERFAQWALENALIAGPIDPSAAFTNAFLPGAATP